jgi:4a-hydroxytetrahydrobiopterin dehydratase
VIVESSDLSSDANLHPVLQQGWRQEGTTLVRELVFRDFDQALRFLERLAHTASDYGRRPDMCISEFNHVRLSIANPHHAGLTLAETRLAAKVDAILAEHHPDVVAPQSA